MSIFAGLRGLFQAVKVQSLPLSYQMDVDEKGWHWVSIYKQQGKEFQSVPDVKALTRYDYREASADGKIIYTVAEEDRQTLAALHSLNPIVNEQGALGFEVTPPILTFLRQKPRMNETAAAREMVVRAEPIKPALKIDYDPDSGLQFKTGYAIEGAEELALPAQFHKLHDTDYVRIGKTLTTLLKPVSDVGKALLAGAKPQVPPDQIPEFILRDLALIQNEFNAVLTDLAGQIQVVTQPLQPTVRVNKAAGGWLDFQVEYKIGDRAWAQSVLEKKQGGNYIQLDDTTWVKNDAKALKTVAKQLQELGAQVVDGQYRVPVAQFASLEEFIDAIGGLRELGAAYQEFIDQLTGFRADADFKLATPIEERLKAHHLLLRPYQREGIHWLHWLNNHRLHGLLADDMGLGKTMQTICAIGHYYAETKLAGHSLIVAPKSVMVHWKREIERCLPHLPAIIYHGGNRQQSQKLFQHPKPLIFISTYGTIANDVGMLAKIPFLFVILDEATNIKNRDAKRSQAAKALNASHRLALSGTPVENRPAELWSLFDFLMRGHLGKFGAFEHKFEAPILNGDQQAAEALGKRIRPFMLRRLKEEVAKDLPEKIEMTEWCELTEEQKNLYGALQDEVRQIWVALRQGEQVNYTTSILPILTKLKQICDHPAIVNGKREPLEKRSEKFDIIVEKVEEILHDGEQVIIFSHFLEMLNLLQEAMGRFNVTWIRIDGSTQNRQPLIDRFNRGEARVALCSLMAAGYGITMTAANHVIHADRWWNPAIEDQATDRVHRIGQDKTVYVHRILTEGTIEERIDQLLEKKRDIAGQVVGAAKAGLQWTREDLLEILKPLEE